MLNKAVWRQRLSEKILNLSETSDSDILLVWDLVNVLTWSAESRAFAVSKMHHISQHSEVIFKKEG